MKTMKYRKLINVCAAFASALALTACDSDVFDINADPAKDKQYSNLLNSPISTYLDGEEDFTEYVKVLRYSDMFNALNQSSAGTSFTAFAPNNEAMRAFYQSRGVDILPQISKDYARSFVLFHTVNDSILPEQFINKTNITNLNEDDISIKIDSTNSGQALLNDEGQVVKMGISAYNGKIYVLSRAMTPLVETVYDRLVNAGNSKIMLEAITATGWQKELSTIKDTVVAIVDGISTSTVNKRYFTVLGVSDATFAKAGINSLSDLKTKLKALDHEGLSEDSLLRAYVGYHILTNSYKADDLGAVNGSSLTRIWGTKANNQVLTVTTDTLKTGTDRYTLNALGTSAKFVDAHSDVLAKNGYVHELSSWLPIWQPEQAEVIWDFADYAEVKNLVPTDDYQPKEPTATEERHRIATAPCFTYEMGEAGSGNNNYSDIDYVTCKANLKNANNHDRVVFNVGYAGSVSMKTPTLVRGKYRVELSIVYLTSNNFMRQQTAGNGGLLKLSFDDKDDYTTYASPYTKVTSALPGVYTSTIYDEIEFPETAAHDFKFVVLDPAASTNSGFSLQFDCIKFIPIK
jgi:uncharacterized surface protein with fasciclin (FAS1) repeats